MNKLYNLLQINGGTFPTGGFSQSWGLETYVADGIVKDAESFRRFLETYLISCIGKCEGPIILEAFELSFCEEKFDSEGLRKLEQLSNASKVTKESREAGLRMGKAFCRIVQSMIEDSRLEMLINAIGTKEISYPVIYGVVCSILEIDTAEMLSAYVYSAANTLVQSAVKLVPLGNTEAQKVLFDAGEIMDKAVRLGLETDVNDITNFCPGIDIASIRHETLPVRLYMS